MGFFGLAPPPDKRSASQSRGVSVETLHRSECKVCPLNRFDGCANPKIEPNGSGDPVIYILGASPNEQADRKGKAWAGDNQRFLLDIIPPAVHKQLRWGNVIRTYPGEGDPLFTREKEPTELPMPRLPSFVEIECCRPSVTRDIEAHKPKAIFGFGGIPLKWAANETHAYQWQGRRIPVKIGKHTCWYYPFVNPEEALKGMRWEGHVSEDQQVFEKAIYAAVKQTMDEDDPDPIIHTADEARSEVEIVTGKNGWKDVTLVKEFLKDATRAKLAGLDYETNALRPYRKTAKFLTTAVSIKGRTVAWANQHRQSKFTPEMQEEIDDAFQDFLYAEKPIKIAHQLSFEMEWSAHFFGKDVLRAGQWGDSISQAYIISETQGLLSLDALCMQYFGLSIKDLSNVDRKNLDAMPLEEVLLYNGIDSKYHRLLYIEQEYVLDDLDMQTVYEHQLRRIPTLVLTQMLGIPIDQKVVKMYRDEFVAEITGYEKELAKLPEIIKFKRLNGAAYRPSASQDTVKLIKQLGHKLSGSKKRGGAKTDSTDEAALRKLKEPSLDLTIKWRKASKLLGTYIDAVSLGSEHLYDDNKVRPIISSYKVRTWRTSSEDPNIQNWPKRSGKAIIRRVVAKSGMKIVAFDYGGIQARNIAMESRDKAFTESFITGYDIHADWVKILADLYPKWANKGLLDDGGENKIFKEARGGVKNQFVFPTFFGAQPKGIAANLLNSGRCEVPIGVVEEMQGQLFKRFPGVKKWQDRVLKFYAENGYVTGHSGFRRHAPIGYNEIINSPIQGDEAIIVLTAMSVLSELDYKIYQPMMEIHDDLTYLWPANEVDARADVVLREMTRPHFDWINTPLLVEMSVGDNWSDLKHVGDFENRMGVKKHEYYEKKKDKK